MLSQVLSHPDQIGLQALRADMVQALGDHPQGIFDLRAIGRPARLRTWLADNGRIHAANQALAVLLGDFFHFIKKLAFGPPISFPVALLHHPQVFFSFLYGHFIFHGHGFPR
jgi:hypothetical protein